MARRSLRPQLNQIRSWVRQGRTDAWIAHQLEATVQEISRFKRENGLAPEDGEQVPGLDFDDEIDLRAEDDALIAAELEAEAQNHVAEVDADGDEEAGDAGEPRPRRSRRGGRGRRKPRTGPLEATFDHGEEGYGLWLDPAVADDPVYAEHWAGHRPVEVVIEEDSIVIKRAAAGDDD